MCVTRFGDSELRNENSNVNIRRFYMQTRTNNVSFHSDDSFDKIIIHWAGIILLHMYILSGK